MEVSIFIAHHDPLKPHGMNDSTSKPKDCNFFMTCWLPIGKSSCQGKNYEKNYEK